MKELYPGIFLIKEKGAFGAIKPPENVYILAGSDGIIYDAGYGSKKVIKFFNKELNKIKEHHKSQNLDFKLTRILISHAHPDHFSGLKRIRDSLGLKVLLTKKTASIIKDKKSLQESFKTDDHEDYLRMRKNIIGKLLNFLRNFGSKLFYRRIYGVTFLNDPDEIIDDNSEISINGEKWKIFPSPGHSFDHISLYNEEKGILFSGDNVLRSITTWLGPPESNIREYINSIKQLETLPNLKLILSAHGSPIENPRERLAEILEHREVRRQQVLNIINENSKEGISPKDIIKILYSNGGKFLHQIARGWVVLTLKILEEQQLITRIEGKKEIKFYPFNKNNYKLRT